MPQCQFPVFCCFLFQKSCSGNILGIGHREDQSPYFPRKHPEVRKRVEDGPRRALTIARCGPPWPRLGMVRRPWSPPHIALSPIYTPPRENPKTISLDPRKVPQPPLSSTLVRGGQKSLFQHPAGTGNCPRKPSPSTPPPSSSPLLTPMMRRE